MAIPRPLGQPIVPEDARLLEDLATLQAALRARGESKLQLAVGNPDERMYVVFAIDGDAYRLREALDAYLDWPTARWDGKIA